MRGRAAASRVHKTTQEEGSSCLWALQHPSLAVLPEESGIASGEESKGLALKFRLGCRCPPPAFFFLKTALPRQSNEIYNYKYFPRVPSSGNLKAPARLTNGSDLATKLQNKNKAPFTQTSFTRDLKTDPVSSTSP